MGGGIVVGRVRGIEISVHYTWLFAFALIAWSLAEGLFPSEFPGWSTMTYWVVGAVSALGLFASVLIHELGHSFVALARGKKVHGITLFIFGGVSNIAEEAEQPKDELLISIVGPLTSFALAGLFWVVGQLLSPGVTPLGATLTYLVLANLLLGAFNLLPGFPLDGGRVLRSGIWAVTGSLRRATQIASYVGQAFGFLFIFWGISQIFTGELLGGLWIAFIGLFLNNAAEATRAQQMIKESLTGVRVAELMGPRPPLVDPSTSVQEMVIDYLIRGGRRAVLVGRDGQVFGIASITDARELDQDAWPRTPVGAIMTLAPLKVVAPDAEASAALRLLAEHDLHQLPVVANGRLVGMVTRADIMRFLQIRQDLGLEEFPEQRARSVAA